MIRTSQDANEVFYVIATKRINRRNALTINCPRNGNEAGEEELSQDLNMSKKKMLEILTDDSFKLIPFPFIQYFSIFISLQKIYYFGNRREQQYKISITQRNSERYLTEIKHSIKTGKYVDLETI